MSHFTKVLFFFATLCVSLGAFAQNQAQNDDKILQDYFKSKHIKPKKTASGLYYTINKEGKGPHAVTGQTVTMGYKGTFLDGKQFDANMDDNYKVTRPFHFVLGRGQVIQGWDEGVQLLNKGCRATMYLPSGIAYGARGAGPIPPNAVLIFEVEVEGID